MAARTCTGTTCCACTCDVIGVEGDPQAVFDRYAIDEVVFPPDTPLAGWLDASPTWDRVYADAVAVIWVRA